MKVSFKILLALAVLAPQALTAKDFEGELRFKVKAQSKKESELNYFVKGEQVRMEWDKAGQEAHPGAVLMDGRSQVMTILMPEQKQFMEMPMKEPQKAAKEAAQREAKRDFEKTGKAETILGYACEQYIAKDEEGVTEMWATKELGRFSGFQTGHEKSESPWQKQLMAQNLFPLKVLERSPAGKEKASWEVTKIDKKSLAADLFTPPSDYKKFEMPAMPNMGSMMIPEGVQRHHASEAAEAPAEAEMSAEAKEAAKREAAEEAHRSAVKAMKQKMLNRIRQK